MVHFLFFLSLLELKNNRAISLVKVYKCNWKKSYNQFAYMNRDGTNMNKELFLWNICFVSTINKKIIRWKKFTIFIIWFFMKENILCILKTSEWIEQLIQALLDVQFTCHCICVQDIKFGVILKIISLETKSIIILSC